MRAHLILLAILACSGCTHRQLSRSMIHQASTISNIEYQIVLDNLAMFTSNPELLPWAIRLTDGTVQVNDEGGVNELGVQWGGTPAFTQGPRAIRSVTEQWGTHPITDPLVVKTLQDIYRQAIGLPPAPDPTLLAELAASADIQLPDNPPTGQGDRASESSGERAAEEPAKDLATENNHPEEISPGLPYTRSPLAQLRGQIEVPSGWFCVGRKKDVPKNACYVGHYCDRYVWVMPERVEDLSHFTLVVLGITKHGLSNQPSRGLIYVRR